MKNVLTFRAVGRLSAIASSPSVQVCKHCLGSICCDSGMAWRVGLGNPKDSFRSLDSVIWINNLVLRESEQLLERMDSSKVLSKGRICGVRMWAPPLPTAVQKQSSTLFPFSLLLCWSQTHLLSLRQLDSGVLGVRGVVIRLVQKASPQLSPTLL